MKIKNQEQLRELYGHAKGRAQTKLLPALEKHGKNFISKSPFLMMASVDAKGRVDNSPRGGAPGFVQVLDDQHIAIPDAKGNNRIDSLVNIVETENVGLLFFIPGVDETLRINGKAHISTESDYLDLFSTEPKPPKTCIVVKIEEVFLHCAKALMRSKLWSEEVKMERQDFPSMGKMLKDQLGGSEPIESQEEMVKRYKANL
jgi:PPOX class probable FMN-dependent enzyme